MFSTIKQDTSNDEPRIRSHIADAHSISIYSKKQKGPLEGSFVAERGLVAATHATTKAATRGQNLSGGLR
jgi:hypothetical protein